MLKNAPISPPEEETPSVPPSVITPLKERSMLFTSTPRSILRSIPKPSLELADTTFKTLQTGAKQHARVYLLASRSVRRLRSRFGVTESCSCQTLSNSLNISLITALFELLYVLYRVIPWNFLQVWAIPSASLPVIYFMLDSYSACHRCWRLAIHYSVSSPCHLPIPRVLECSSPLVNTHFDHPCSPWLRHFIPPGERPLCTRPPRASSRLSHGIHHASGCSVRVPVQSSRTYN